MNVYIIALSGGGDFYWYILDTENWNKIDDRELCEQIHDVKHLGRPGSLIALFNTLKRNGWVVADALEGVSY